jgi:hypothetical protein
MPAELANSLGYMSMVTMIERARARTQGPATPR